jgi:alpha-L-rhamnosidase
LNHVLARFGHEDVAYALLMQKTFPSWLYPITQGATTMWERWDAWTHEKGFNDTGMNSFNHYAYGAVGEWMYAAIAGIDLDAAEPGYKRIVIHPRPGGGLTWARGSLRTMYGRVESGWEIENGRMIIRLVIPANTSARVVLPGREITESGKAAAKGEGIRAVQVTNDSTTLEIGAGTYAFEARLPATPG